jgi:hypothetical protein
MIALASPIVVWSAIWKILVASLAGGAGVAIVFGFVILGTERAQQAGEGTSGKALNYSIAFISAAFCILAVVVGVYAMTKK